MFESLLPHAERREHPIEHILWRNGADQVIERHDRGAQMRRRCGRIHALGTCPPERLQLGEGAVECAAVTRSRDDGFDISECQEVTKSHLRETAP